MAVVYMAEQTEPIHRKVAVKLIKLGMDIHCATEKTRTDGERNWHE